MGWVLLGALAGWGAATPVHGEEACRQVAVEAPAPADVSWADAEPSLRALIAVSPASSERITLLVQCGAPQRPVPGDMASEPPPETLHSLSLAALERARREDASFEQRLRDATVEAARWSRERGTDDMAAYRSRLESRLRAALFGDRDWVSRLKARFAEVLAERGRRCTDCAPVMAAAPPAPRP
jgi:hypothetical protein